MLFYLVVFAVVICTQLQNTGASPSPVPDASVQQGSVYAANPENTPFDLHPAKPVEYPADTRPDGRTTSIYNRLGDLCSELVKDPSWIHM